MSWVCKGCIKILSVIPFCLGLLLLFCLHSVKYTTEHIPCIDHKQSDAKGLTIICDTQNIHEIGIPQSALALSQIITV